MKNCPNPECEGSEDSLEIVDDDRCIRNRCCWVHCDWCGVSGPTSGPSDESAIEAWDRLPTNSVIDEVIADEKIEKLEAEVERLKVELERQRILHNECAQCGAALHDCTEPPHCDGCVVDEDKFAEWEVATATSPERLKVHTWQQERAAVVALSAGWIDAMSPSPNEFNPIMTAKCGVLSELICIIEAGEHWPTERQ